jgi:stage II sporulation protein D
MKRRILFHLILAMLAWAGSLDLFPAFAAKIPPERPADRQPGPVGLLSHPGRIRVRLANAEPRVLLHGYDLRFYEGVSSGKARHPALAGSRQVASVDRRSEWELHCHAGRIRATERGGGRGPAKTLDLREPVTVETPAGFLHFRNQPYREALHIYSNGSSCEVVNELDIEKYLEGLVNHEFNSAWSPEAIAAQVIAARTYAYYQMRQANLSGARFDVENSVRDQVYDGFYKEDYRAAREVQRTRGVVLTAERLGDDPEPIKAFYHSTCGGHTTLPQQVWGRKLPGFRHGVTCPYCASSPRLHWELEVGGPEIAAALLRGAGEGRGPREWPRGWREALTRGSLARLRVKRRFEDARVEVVTTEWAVGGRTVALAVPGARFRDWLGSTQLRSTNFEAHRDGEGGRWRFTGRGYGHGVGMCQWGAKVMAERGFAYAAILHHYYPDAFIRKLW